jgi:hypothetical protein
MAVLIAWHDDGNIKEHAEVSSRPVGPARVMIEGARGADRLDDGVCEKPDGPSRTAL